MKHLTNHDNFKSRLCVIKDTIRIYHKVTYSCKLMNLCVVIISYFTFVQIRCLHEQLVSGLNHLFASLAITNRVTTRQLLIETFS